MLRCQAGRGTGPRLPWSRLSSLCLPLVPTCRNFGICGSRAVTIRRRRERIRFRNLDDERAALREAIRLDSHRDDVSVLSATEAAVGTGEPKRDQEVLAAAPAPHQMRGGVESR